LNFHFAEFGTNIMSLVMTLQVAGLHGVNLPIYKIIICKINKNSYNKHKNL